jgi:hypothetical protein
MNEVKIAFVGDESKISLTLGTNKKPQRIGEIKSAVMEKTTQKFSHFQCCLNFINRANVP